MKKLKFKGLEIAIFSRCHTFELGFEDTMEAANSIGLYISNQLPNILKNFREKNTK